MFPARLYLIWTISAAMSLQTSARVLLEAHKMRAITLMVGLLAVSDIEAWMCPLAPRNALNGRIRTEEEQECDPCGQIFDPNSNFMQTCGNALSAFDIAILKDNCEHTPGHQLSDFVDYLAAQYCPCDFPNEECKCDLCEKLFDPNSDFMQSCAFDLSGAMLSHLRGKCEDRDCGTNGLIDLEKTFAYFCATQGRTFDFPTCECDECVLMFKTNSPFMQECGGAMDDSTLTKLFETCSLCMDDVSALFTFFQTVKIVCAAAGFPPFVLPICDCTDICWHLFDPERTFYKDCYSLLPFSRRLALFKTCRSVHNDTSARENFVSDLEAECLTLTGKHTKVPRDCVNCEYRQFDVVLVVDNSGSIDSSEMTEQKAFLAALVNSFSISDIETRIGIIKYGTSETVVQHLGEQNSATEVNDDINDFQACYSGPCPQGPLTNTEAAINAMSRMFTTYNNGNQQFGIVLTDGVSTVGDVSYAVPIIPAGVTMFGVGVKDFNSAELQEIAGDPSRVFEVDAFAALSGIINGLREKICT